MEVWLNGFPLAHSVNNSLMPVPGKPKRGKNGHTYRVGRLVKTKEARHFEELCVLWSLQNRDKLAKVKHNLLEVQRQCEARKERFALKVECFFAFEESRIFTVNNKNEQLDADNRLKPTLDGLKLVLGIDDKAFFHASCEKVATHSKDLECAIVKISLMRPRTLTEITQQTSQKVFSSAT